MFKRHFTVALLALAAFLAPVAELPIASSVVRPAAALAAVGVTQVNAQMYGAVGNGAHDDTAALNAAITYVNATGGGIVSLPPGTYKVNSQLVLKDKVVLAGSGRNNTTLDMSTTTATTAAVTATGTVSSALPTFSNITADAKTITFGSAPGVVAGDLLVITNSATSSWNTSRTYYQAGEFVRVASIAGNVVTLEHPLYDAYTGGATTSIYKVTPVTVGVRDLAARFKTGLSGVNVTYGYRCTFHDLILSGSDQSNLQIDRCFNTNFERISVDDYTDPTAGLNYGITIGNSQGIHVSGCFLSTYRHGLTTGGGSFTGNVPCRDLVVENNTITSKNDSLWGLDLHGNSEFAVLRNNILPTGVAVGGDQCVIAGNLIHTNKVNPSGIYLDELKGPNWTIENNTIIANADGQASSNSAMINVGMNNSAFASCSRDGAMRIVNNFIDLGSYNGRAIDVLNQFSNAVIDMDVTGNIVKGAASTFRLGIYVAGDGSHGFRSVAIKNNNIINASIQARYTASRLLDIENNTVYNADTSGIAYVNYATGYAGTQPDQTINISNNTVYKPNKTGIQLGGDGDGTKTTLIVRGNVATGCVQGGTTGSSYTDSSIYVTNAATAIVDGNVIGKDAADASSSQTKSFGAFSVTNLFERNNHNIGTLASQIGSITNRYGGFSYNGANKVGFGTAAPSGGTYAVGDIVWNVSPAAGSALGWICTVAGSPGTWKELAPVSL